MMAGKLSGCYLMDRRKLTYPQLVMLLISHSVSQSINRYFNVSNSKNYG